METPELGLVEDRDDIVIAGIEEEMMVPKGVLIALVEVLNIGKAEEGALSGEDAGMAAP